MGLLGKKKKEDKEASLVQDEARGALENPDVVIDNKVSSIGEADDEKALLEQYTGGLSMSDLGDGEDDAEATEALVEDTLSEASNDDDGVSDALMDIFASEEVEDIDMSVLTQDLEDVDVHSLLAEARDIASRLRNLVGP